MAIGTILFPHKCIWEIPFPMVCLKSHQQIMIVKIQHGQQTQIIKEDKSFLNLFLICPDFPNWPCILSDLKLFTVPYQIDVLKWEPFTYEIVPHSNMVGFSGLGCNYPYVNKVAFKQSGLSHI